jgi:hypothetical protein
VSRQQQALAAGANEDAFKTLDGASGTNWLGLAPGQVCDGMFDGVKKAVKVSDMDVMTIDVSALERQTVNVLPLLLQVGLLTRVPGEPMAVTPPNEYARRSLQKMLENALGGLVFDNPGIDARREEAEFHDTCSDGDDRAAAAGASGHSEQHSQGRCDAEGGFFPRGSLCSSNGERPALGREK